MFGEERMSYAIGATNHRYEPKLDQRFEVEFFNSADLSGEPVHRGEQHGGEIFLFGYVAPGITDPKVWSARYGTDFTYRVDGRIYVDVGTKEGSEELRDVTRLRDRLVEMGYRHGIDMLFMIDFGAGHTESAWAGRIEKELRFFLACETDADPAVPAVITTGG